MDTMEDSVNNMDFLFRYLPRVSRAAMWTEKFSSIVSADLQAPGRSLEPRENRYSSFRFILFSYHDAALSPSSFRDPGAVKRSMFLAGTDFDDRTLRRNRKWREIRWRCFHVPVSTRDIPLHTLCSSPLEILRWQLRSSVFSWRYALR